ncbi:MAG: DUF6506 family protein [Rubrobacter sp.]|nr:DUF6506 family protein [Rubrobacter sp.]
MSYKKAIIREAEGADPSTDRIVMRDGSAESIIVCVPDPYAALELSKELADGGVELIELYGSPGSAAAA